MIGIMLAVQVAAGSTGQAGVGALPSPACEVVAVAREAGRSDLYGSCGDAGVRLGPVNTYRSSYNALLKSVVVVSVLNGRRRVLLLSQSGDGSPFVNDLTRELTVLSGRYAEAGLVDDVDLTAFAVDGLVSVPSRPVPRDLPQGVAMIAASKSVGGALPPALPARLDLKRHVEAVTARAIGVVPAVNQPVAEQVGVSSGER